MQCSLGGINTDAADWRADGPQAIKHLLRISFREPMGALSRIPNPISPTRLTLTPLTVHPAASQDGARPGS